MTYKVLMPLYHKGEHLKVGNTVSNLSETVAKTLTDSKAIEPINEAKETKEKGK